MAWTAKHRLKTRFVELTWLSLPAVRSLQSLSANVVSTTLQTPCAI